MPAMIVSLVSSSKRTLNEGSSMESFLRAAPSFSSSFFAGGMTFISMTEGGMNIDSR